MFRYRYAGLLLILVSLLHGCSVSSHTFREYPVRQPKDTALVLIETTQYKIGLAKSLALRLNDLGVSVSIDDIVNASNHRASDYGATLLIVSLKKGIFNHEAEDFLKNNFEADNLALYVTKGKKFMQLPREIIALPGIDTITSASIVHPQEDMLEHLEVLLCRRLHL